ncbi:MULTISPECIES: hypothetical protein [Nocardia]|uniref:Uncharacterized protein n=1 Tax=Nocardia elegans TaxID=300029 RepID=A0ABW6TQA5_9NOCA|nr:MULTISPECIES: hypothetical protein [Nocardia]MBF6246268.1 hypothetical protein [Nocardia elegans]MBF6446639.1 hypothetical protein [Nocardia elegans]
MKPRKSTAILVSVWVATLVLYLFVKPATPDHSGFNIANTVSGSALTTAPAR